MKNKTVIKRLITPQFYFLPLGIYKYVPRCDPEVSTSVRHKQLCCAHHQSFWYSVETIFRPASALDSLYKLPLTDS